MYIYLEQDSEFIPTWLYVKQHNITDMKYFGKTTKNDPIKYKGSGKYWLRHLRKYGNNVSTIWCHLFFDKDNLVKFAEHFSKQNDIEYSTEWANIIPENGINGGAQTDTIRQKVYNTKLKNGTLNVQTPERARKAVETRKRNGSYFNSKESIRKCKLTKIKNGTMNSNTPESIKMAQQTKMKRYGSTNNHSKESAEKRKKTILERYGSFKWKSKNV